MGKFKDLTGQTFGRLTVLERTGIAKNRNIKWLCVCICGNQKEIVSSSLISSITLSCGCLQKERTSKQNKTHGESKQRFYNIWKRMNVRCLNPKSEAYKYYGARGITICDSWLTYENFKTDMYESYLSHVKTHGEKQTSIDRIDVNGNYEPKNVRWATISEQMGNTRKNKSFKAISPEGVEYLGKNQREFARHYTLDRLSIALCLKGKHKQHKGWTFIYV